ncbi:MAG: hypothetical protein JJE40_04385 [Vicinamibacteria bacterium]|nr:hypothetical protein [Vicinamibacteria bacterium]
MIACRVVGAAALTFLGVGAAAGEAPAVGPPRAIRWTAQVVGPVEAGEVFVVELRATPTRGWRFYGQHQPGVGPTPLSIAAASSGLSLAGDVKADPAPEERYDKVWAATVRLHTRETVFRVPLRAQAAAGGATSVQLRVRWQACSDEICLRPLETLVTTGADVR